MPIQRKDLPYVSKQVSEAANGIQAGENEQALANLKNYLGQQTGQDNLKAAQDYIEQNAAKGRKVSASIGSDGQVALSQNEPNVAIQMQRMQLQNQKNENDAYKNAANHYQQGVSQGNTVLGALKTGLNALQSNDASSLGQLRAAYVLGNGFKRYNPDEATALGPDGAQSSVAGLLSKAGLDPQGATLNDAQRSNFVRFANGKLDELQDMHNTLKSQAQNLYSNSQFADINKAANLGNTLGAPVDEQLHSLKGQFDKFHSQAIPQSQATGSNAPSTGLRGLFSKLMGGGSPSPAQAPQQTPQGGNAPLPQSQGSFDPNAFLQGK